MKNKFITIEGIEGVGKTTALVYIQDYLQKCGFSLCVTREPGGTLIGEQIRHILLSPESKGMIADTELLLFFASRAQHIASVINPALEKGEWVICDRFTDASYAYQVGGRKIEADRVAVLENWVQGELQADATLLLDAPVEIALERAKGRQVLDRIETETLTFFQRVREAYLKRAKQFPKRFHVIDATHSLKEVQAAIEKWLENLCRL